MTLYVWTGKDVFCEYFSGKAMAMANTVDEARALIKAAVTVEEEDIFGYDPEYLAERLEQQLAFLNRTPNIQSSEPIAVYHRGGG